MRENVVEKIDESVKKADMVGLLLHLDEIRDRHVVWTDLFGL